MLSKSSGIALLSLAAALTLHGSYSAMAQSTTPPPADHPQGPPPGWAPRWNQPIASSQTVQAGGGALQVDFAVGALDLTPAQILPWLQRAAQAVAVYYGRYPVARVRILIVPVADKAGVLQGTTWGDMASFPSFTRIRLGQHTTTQDLVEDWTMTHELVHAAFPSLPDDQHWMEEGLPPTSSPSPESRPESFRQNRSGAT